jgi:hypothetical protein
MTPAFRTYVSQNKGKLRRAAFFSTFSVSRSEKMLDELGKMCGLEPIALLGLDRKKAEERGHVAHVEKFVEEIRADLSRSEDSEPH